nr:MAG TPA: hypothetical protein [Bacteriophage sp.]
MILGSHPPLIIFKQGVGGSGVDNCNINSFISKITG